jgi:GntR family transcriptional repressor for pyruvate dehydrogenase complex
VASRSGAPKATARTASEAIAEKIRAEIATGQVEPGQMLPSETALLEEFAVARSTMREALRILESDGLITVQRGTKGGARVREPNIRALARRFGLHLQRRDASHRDLIETQAEIQQIAARLAAVERTDDDLQRLRAAVQATAETTTAEEYLSAVERFAAEILASAHNPVLELVGEIAEVLGQEALRQFMDDIGASTLYSAEFFQAEAVKYGRLVDLIEAGDADGAEAFWRGYMAETGAAHPFGPEPLNVYTVRRASRAPLRAPSR